MKKDSGKNQINVGLIGLGTIGAATARVLIERADTLSWQVGCPVVLKKAADIDPGKKSVLKNSKVVFTSAAAILNDPEIDIVVELIGGEHPAVDFMKEALTKRKWVVTANKNALSRHGYDLFKIAQEHGVDILFSASVGGGIPLIDPLRNQMVANKITTIYAIINGTTNYILTNMAKGDMDLPSALKEAQAQGYAEADPTSDVEGEDAAYKIAILATLGFHTRVHPDNVYREGITRLTSRDFRYAQELGYVIKLLAITKEINDNVEVRVHPTFINSDILLAKVDGVFNAIQIEGDLIGKTLFYGQGAGPSPTSSNVTGDIIHAAHNIIAGKVTTPGVKFGTPKHIKPISDIETRYYIRMNVEDKSGVLGQITRVLGDRAISISSVIQKLADEKTQTAEIVIMTHPAKESSMQQALQQMADLPVVKEISSFIRVEA